MERAARLVSDQASESFSYEFEFGIPMAAAELRVEDVAAEGAAEWLAFHDDRACMAEVDEFARPGVVRVGWLAARCPHCRSDVPRATALENAGWVTVPGCDGSIAVTREEGGAEATFPVYDGALPLRGPDRAIPLVEAELFERLPAGVRSIAAAVGRMRRQGRLEATGIPPAKWHLGLGDAFAGTYRCPDCGGLFIAVLSAIRDEVEDEAGLSTRADISRDERGIAIELIGYGSRHHIEFAFHDGSLTVDGTLKVRPGLFFDPSAGEQVEGAFDDLGFYGAVAALFPDGWRVPRDADAPGFRALALRNRFHGYPEGFYEDLKYKNHPGLRRVVKPFGLNLLPVEYEDIGEAFAMSLLPPGKRMRRLVFERPALLAWILTFDKLPFRNADVLQALLAHPQADRYITAIAECAELWAALAESKGDAATWRHLLRCGPDEAARCGDEWKQLLRRAPSGALADAAARMPIGEAMHAAPFLDWELGHGGKSCDGRYAHLPAQRALEGRVRGYEFTLPERPRDVIEASVSMGNCLASYAGRIPDTTIVFARTEGTREGAPKAAIEVDLGARSVAQALLSHNRPIRAGSDLDAALRQWAADRGLAI